MVGEAILIGLCLVLWGVKAYVAANYQVRRRTAFGVRWIWKRGTPDWITRAVPWLEFLGWVALLGCIAWWARRAAPTKGALPLAMCSPDVGAQSSSFQ